MTEKAYKEWLQNEYIKKKKSTLDSLRSMSVDELFDHIKAYKEFILAYAEDHEEEIVDGNLQGQIENQLRQIDDLETVLNQGITNALANIMLDEEIIVHLVEKKKKDKVCDIICETSFE
ncbi:MAG TPA: hypothetical protein VIK67_05590 [Acholeplasma sp.]|jgi:hypothetical protein